MKSAMKTLVVLVVLFGITLASPAIAGGKPVAIVVEYVALDGKEQELLGILREHARRTVREETGCLEFKVLKPIDESGRPLPGRLMLEETYADEAAADAHAKNPRLSNLLSRLRPLLAAEKVTRTIVLTSPTL
jgi:(4S)-4-hydroxy-5-phosphonooxypentane-2,3-dione isomerase